MGITGLLPFVKKASRPCFLSEFRGSVAAIDTYCLLHKGAFSCADKLVRGEDTDGYVVYVMKFVRLLLSHRIKPIMVFDGCNLPSKAGTDAKRRENRAKYRALAKERLREGRDREAIECYQRAINITSLMASAVMKACREINVDVIVAPYEADAQLAYLTTNDFADLVITEDSDLILFGCPKVLFKLDLSGGCVLVEQSKLHLALGQPQHKFSLSQFRNICVLSGCDYLPSLPGIGLGRAAKFFQLTTNADTYNVLSKLPSYLKMSTLEVTVDYREAFMKALATFLYQLVFCPRDRLLRPLNTPDDGTGPSDHPYAGSFMGHAKALQIALGNIDIQTEHKVDNFDPDKYKAPAVKSSNWSQKGDLVSCDVSIWDPAYDRQAYYDATHREKGGAGGVARSGVAAAFAPNDTTKVGKKPGASLQKKKKDLFSGKKSPFKRKEVTKEIDIKQMFTKRKREEDNDSKDDLSDLFSLYGCAKKSSKSDHQSNTSNRLSFTPSAATTTNPFAKFKHCSNVNPFSTKKQLASKPDNKLTSAADEDLAGAADEEHVSTSDKEIAFVTDKHYQCESTASTSSRLTETKSQISEIVRNERLVQELESKTCVKSELRKLGDVDATTLAQLSVVSSPTTSKRRVIVKSRYFRAGVSNSSSVGGGSVSEVTGCGDATPQRLEMPPEGAIKHLECSRNDSESLIMKCKSETSSSNEMLSKDSLSPEMKSADKIYALHETGESMNRTSKPMKYPPTKDTIQLPHINKVLTISETSSSADPVSGEDCQLITADTGNSQNSCITTADTGNSQNSCITTADTGNSQNSCITTADSLDRESFGLTPSINNNFDLESVLSPKLSSQDCESLDELKFQDSVPLQEPEDKLRKVDLEESKENRILRTNIGKDNKSVSNSNVLKCNNNSCDIIDLDEEDNHANSYSKSTHSNLDGDETNGSDDEDSITKTIVSHNNNNNNSASLHKLVGSRLRNLASVTSPVTSRPLDPLSSSSSPYFRNAPQATTLKKTPSSGCRKPGLCRPSKSNGGGRQLNIRDMFRTKM